MVYTKKRFVHKRRHVMKCILAILALFSVATASAAEEYRVTGVMCKNQEDLVAALYTGNVGVFLPDALAKFPACMIVLKYPVTVQDPSFLGWVPAGIVKVRVYHGKTPAVIMNDSGILVPHAKSEWFFTPTEKSGIPVPKKFYRVIPT
jgi:hypothetical protein